MECARLRQDDIDHRRGLLRIVQGKGRKDRVVPIGARALSWVQRYERDARPTLHPDPDNKTLFIAQRRDRGLSRDVLSVIVRQYLKAAGINKPGSCHIFRHSMATALHRAGCDVRILQEMLGHSKLDTTALYTQVGAAQIKAAHAAFHPASTASDAAQLAADQPRPPKPPKTAE